MLEEWLIEAYDIEMENAKHKKQLKEPQVEGDVIENPTTDIGEATAPNDVVNIAVQPVEYRRIKRNLKYFSMQLKNSVIAYMGNEVIKISRCIGYYYNKDKTQNDAMKKAIADSMANDQSCVILVDSQQNTYVALLDSDVYYRDVHTPDDFSSPYAGLTYLETRGKHYASTLWAKLLVTTDKHVLTPIVNDEDYIPGNAYYTRINESVVYESDYIIYLVSLIKSGKLESYIKGHARYAK